MDILFLTAGLHPSHSTLFPNSNVTEMPTRRLQFNAQTDLDHPESTVSNHSLHAFDYKYPASMFGSRRIDNNSPRIQQGQTNAESLLMTYVWLSTFNV